MNLFILTYLTNTLPFTDNMKVNLINVIILYNNLPKYKIRFIYCIYMFIITNAITEPRYSSSYSLKNGLWLVTIVKCHNAQCTLRHISTMISIPAV